MSQDGYLTFLGDRDLSDYFDFIVPADRVSRFYPALFSCLSDLDWRTLDLPSLPAGSPTLDLPAETGRIPWLARRNRRGHDDTESVPPRHMG